ncbi:MAG TPA: SpoIIE family protein phosphatase [Bryobacteraceae bacterium]|nr:SpoIIE family protein phosphatase [Bryobacteraceae bacterium]
MPQVAREAAAELLVTYPDGTRRIVPLTGERHSLGRALSNDLSFPEEGELSRNHLAFERSGSDWIIRDLGSTNGTSVNGRPLHGHCALRTGDLVEAGRLKLEFRFAVAAAPDRTVLFLDPPPASQKTSTVVKERASLDSARAAIAGTSRSMQALIRAGQELSSHLPLDELFRLILDLSIEAVGASRGVLVTMEGTEFVVRAVKGEHFRISAAIRDRVIRERASLLVVDTMLDSALRQRQSIVLEGVRSFMAVPLQTRDKVIGLIYVDAQRLLHTFTEEDLSLLTVMANIAAARIEQARLAEVEHAERMHAYELQQAAEIQARLLPAEIPQIPGLEIARLNLPCRTVGGDYYDVLVQGDRVALLVGDVAGKGMPAAIMMSNLQARLRTLAPLELSPAELVSRLNHGVAEGNPGNRFVTLFYGLFEPASRTLMYSNAGHNPPLVIGASGRTDHLEGGGPVLGLLPSVVYEMRRIRLGVGDVLVLYSDGVTEANRANSEVEFGEDRLADIVRANAGRPTQMILNAIVDALYDWTAGAPFADDVTLLIARLPGSR